MRNAIIAFAFIIAGIVCFYAFANTKMLNLTDNSSLTTFANIGMFITTLIAGIYAVYEYDGHKSEMRTNLLCIYNQRYSTDNNIKCVIKWMLKVAKIEKGEIVGVKEVAFDESRVFEKEMFMRFFEEINKRIDNNDIKEKDAYDLFSYYALKFDEHIGFRTDITDYKNEQEIKNLSEVDKNKYNDPWPNFRSFINKMKEEERKQKYKGHNKNEYEN